MFDLSSRQTDRQTYTHSEANTVVKVRGFRGSAPLLPFEPPAIV